MTQVSVPTELLAKALNLADSAGDNETAEALRALLPQPDEAREVWDAAYRAWLNCEVGDETAIAIIREALERKPVMTREVEVALGDIASFSGLRGPISPTDMARLLEARSTLSSYWSPQP